MLLLIDTQTHQPVRIGSQVTRDDEPMTLRWFFDTTHQSPDGTVHVSDAEGRVFSYHARDFGLRVVDGDTFVPEPVMRKVRTRQPAASA